MSAPLQAPGAASATILVVDDEPYIADLLSAGLRFEGFGVEVASTAEEALATTARCEPDLVLLDVMLPDLDGTELCRRLRERGSAVPVVFVTARDATEDKVAGLALGDDYITKPFSLSEVVARVRAVLRRARPNGEGSPPGVLTYADVVVDVRAHEAWRQDRLLELTPTEFKLLEFLVENARRVVSKSEILDAVWDYELDREPTIVETYISYLRKKVDEMEPPLIHTVRGVGYCFRLPRA